MFSSWPVFAFVAGVKIGSRQLLRLDQPVRQRVAADLAGREVVLPARAGEVAAHDALDRQHLEPPALGRAAVVAQREQVVRDDLARAREPERRQAGQHAALVGDLGRQDDVEGRDAVAGDEQQALVVERVELADLAASDVRGASDMNGFLLRGETAQTVEACCRGWRSSRRGRRRRRARRRRACARDLGVGADERREVALLVPRAHRVALHEPVGVGALERRASTSASSSRCEKKRPCDAQRLRSIRSG